ncbi:hypothetical protein BDN67DRAFT_201704 [Paxillus ammoniavirescens]|nr:hypothetical protein BDN67DRAFT_201704 [Paxillus ammoniavirescens]
MGAQTVGRWLIYDAQPKRCCFNARSRCPTSTFRTTNIGKLPLSGIHLSKSHRKTVAPVRDVSGCCTYVGVSAHKISKLEQGFTSCADYHCTIGLTTFEPNMPAWQIVSIVTHYR